MIELKEMPLIRLSICPCGWTVLKDHIGLGTVYKILSGSLTDGMYYCGGCGRSHEVDLVMCSQSDEPGLRPLPAALFLKRRRRK